MKHRIVKLAGLVLLLPLSITSWALEQLDDVSLAEQTGQDGITIGIELPNSSISFDQAVLVDRGGIAGSSTHNNTGSLVFAPTFYDSFQGVRLLSTTSGAETAASMPIKIFLDADANGTQPLFNINFMLPADMKRIKIKPFSIFLASGDASTSANDIFTTARTRGVTAGSGTATAYTNIRAGVREILRVGGSATGGGIDVVFADYHATDNPNNIVSTNVQLGRAAQGALLRFTGGSIKSISNPASATIQLLSYNGSNPIDPPSNVEPNSIKFDLNIQATNQSTGFRLYDFDGAGGFGGFTMNIPDDGLIFAADGTTDKLDVAINNVVAGLSGSTSSGSFGNLPNGPMGNFGIVGATVTNLKVNVKGM